MRRISGLSCAALIITAVGCATPPVPGPPAAPPEIAGRTAGPPQNCVNINSTSSLRISGQGAVVYTSGPTVWVNRLATQCRGITDFDILVAHPNGSQYCRGDVVQPINPASKIPGPSCILGDFVPYRR